MPHYDLDLDQDQGDNDKLVLLCLRNLDVMNDNGNKYWLKFFTSLKTRKAGLGNPSVPNTQQLHSPSRRM